MAPVAVNCGSVKVVCLKLLISSPLGVDFGPFFNVGCFKQVWGFYFVLFRAWLDVGLYRANNTQRVLLHYV